MDIILYNGRIYSMVDETDVHDAIAIKDGLIVQIGTNEEILTLKEHHTEVIDLKNRFVFPGFNDSHMHLMGYGAALMQVDLSPARSIEDVIAITRSFIEENALPQNAWVIGRGWNQDHFISRSMPDADDLDKISDKHFIMLRRTCGHVATVNSKVLDALNLGRAYQKVEGGEYYDGIFKENALELILSSIPDPTLEEMKRWIIKATDKLHSLGITSVQSDDLCVYPEYLSKQIFDTFTDLASNDELNMRVYEQSLFRNYANLNNFILAGYKQNHTIGHFKYGPLKILGDGSLGGRTAWLKESYADADTCGIHMYSQSELDNLVALAQENNIATAIHCIGNAMLDSALDAIEKAQISSPKVDLRHGIVHCQITSLEQLQRMKKLNVLAYVQPIFLDYDLHIVKERVGESLAGTSYAWHTMETLDIPIAFGSDAPVETPDPIKGIHCAVKRQDLHYRPKEGYLGHEKVSVFNAVRHYTVDGAYTSYDTNKGMLLGGYVADLVVLNGNIFEDILDSRVHMTIFNGRIVFEDSISN